MVITVRNNRVQKLVINFNASINNETNEHFNYFSSSENSEFLANEGDQNAFDSIVSFRWSQHAELCDEISGICTGKMLQLHA